MSAADYLDSELARLLEQARKLPPMTEQERAWQRLDFAYGNLACSTNHRPQRKVFRAIAVLDMGLDGAEFDAWADRKEWY